MRIPNQEPLTLKPSLGKLASITDYIFGLDDLVATLRRTTGSGREFVRTAMQEFGISSTWTDRDLGRIPREGPLIVTCNCPHGVGDGLVALDLLLRARPDTRVLASHLLQDMAGISPLVIRVNPSSSSDNLNLLGIRKALSHLKTGGCLLIFPAGQVASFRLLERAVRDEKWTTHAVRLAKTTGATIVPLNIEGRNRIRFQLAGFIHSRLRTAMLVREMLALKGKTIRLRTGKAMSCERLAEHASDEVATKFLRLRCELLHSRLAGLRKAPSKTRTLAPIVPPVTPSLLKRELESLPVDRCLLSAGKMSVWHFKGDELPSTMREIGRLREITFRTVSEGSGLSTDIDAFDGWYDQMVLWDDEHSKIVGGYRLGPTERILNEKGKNGLYTSTLFNFRPNFFEQIGPALELGRSFIRSEYQQKPNALPLLWRGIGSYLFKYPNHHTLFGAISINPEYSPSSRELMLHWLRYNRTAPKLASFVKAKNPPRAVHLQSADLKLLKDSVFELDHLNRLVSELEPDEKTLPTLLKHYLKLNGRLIASNIDEGFGGCLDCLITVDLVKADPKLLSTFYFGENSTRTFLDFHSA